MLEHVNAKERVEVNVLVQHVRVDIMQAFALAASRQREGLLRHLIADERTFGQVSLELYEDLAGAAAYFGNPQGLEIVAAKDVVNFLSLPRRILDVPRRV